MPLVKDVGKPDEGEPHVRIDGGELETGQPSGPSAGPRPVCWKMPPRGLVGAQPAGHCNRASSLPDTAGSTGHRCSLSSSASTPT